MDNKTVSVIMPVYNAEKYLSLAIESILNQSFRDFEFIIINDGSTDDSISIINLYKNTDERIKVIDRENKGLIFSLNEAINLSIGKYIARMDADDISLTERFDKQVEFLECNHDHVAVGTFAYLIDSEGSKLIKFGDKKDHHSIDAAHLNGYGGSIIHPSAMIRRESLVAIGGYNYKYKHAEDVDIWLRLAEIGKLANIDEVLFHYRQHLESIGYNKRFEQIDSLNKAIYQAFLRRGLDTNRYVKKEYNEDEINWHDVFLKWGWWSFSGGNYMTSIKYSIKSIRYDPLCFSAYKLFLKSFFKLISKELQ